MTASQS